VRVLETCYGLSFPLKSLHYFVVGGMLLLEDFDCDQTTGHLVHAFVDRAHAACAYPAHNFILVFEQSACYKSFSA
jgi:hypothetical protein